MLMLRSREHPLRTTGGASWEFISRDHLDLHLNVHVSLSQSFFWLADKKGIFFFSQLKFFPLKIPYLINNE